MGKCRGNFWDAPISMEHFSEIMGQEDLSLDFWENAPREDKKEMLRMLKEKSLEEEVDEAIIIKKEKGSRKPTTRGERRKQKFAHKSEREKKRIRKYSGDRLLDRHSGWVNWNATIQERKRENIEKMSLRSWREETDWWENHRWEDEEPTVNEDPRKRWEDAFELHMGLCRMYTDRAKEYGTEFYATAAEEHRQHALDVLNELQYIK